MLGIDIDEEKESQRSADLFKELKIRREQVPLKPIFEGKLISEFYSTFDISISID